MSDAYTGEIRLLPYPRTPFGWSLCEGQQLAINDYQALFSLIGFYFGGDNRTFFKLPNLKGRIAVGKGQRPGGYLNWNLGQQFGEQQSVLSAGTMPQHSHVVQVEVEAKAEVSVERAEKPQASPGDWIANGRVEDPSGGFVAGIWEYKRNPGPSSLTGMGSVNVTGNPVLEAAGAVGPEPFENTQPCTELAYFICLNGIYPQRP